MAMRVAALLQRRLLFGGRGARGWMLLPVTLPLLVAAGQGIGPVVNDDGDPSASSEPPSASIEGIQDYPRNIDDLPPLPRASGPNQNEPLPPLKPASGPSGRRNALAIRGRTFRLESVNMEEEALERLEAGAGSEEPFDLAPLQKRPSMLHDEAVLLRFGFPDRWTLWMRDVFLSADALFLTDEGEVLDIQEMRPQPFASPSQMSRHQAAAPASLALLLPAGVADELGVKIGSTLEGAIPEAEQRGAGDGVVSGSPSSRSLRAMADAAVAAMASARSYRANGAVVTEDRKAKKQVREQFIFQAPKRLHTRFVTDIDIKGLGSGGGSIQGRAECGDAEIILMGSSKFQRCLSRSQSWDKGSFSGNIFGSLSFRPWVRFQWCQSIEDLGAERLAGVENRLFGCRVPAGREAATAFRSGGLDGGVSRGRFEREAQIDIRVWVRRTDGKIGRFFMRRIAPSDVGPVTQTTDYVYTQFGEVRDIRPPQ